MHFTPGGSHSYSVSGSEVMVCTPTATAHLDDRVETGEGWLPSETPLSGELWSLSPLFPQVCSGKPASSLNSWPVIMRSISSFEIYSREAREKRREGNKEGGKRRESLCSFSLVIQYVMGLLIQMH